MLDPQSTFIVFGFVGSALIAIIFAIVFYVTIHIEKSPCDTCRHYQPKLNPRGCFIKYAITDGLSRTWKKVTGCVKYECN